MTHLGGLSPAVVLAEESLVGSHNSSVRKGSLGGVEALGKVKLLGARLVSAHVRGNTKPLIQLHACGWGTTER